MPRECDGKITLNDETISTQQLEARKWLNLYETEYLPLCLEATEAAWEQASNITDYNSMKNAEASQKMVKFTGNKGREAQKFAWKQFKDPELKRIFKSLSNLGVAALPQEKTAEMIRLRQEMESNHAKTKVCPYRKPNEPPASPEECTLGLEPEIKEILEQSQDYDELLHVWSQFRDKAGKPVKNKWLKVASILNEGSRANGRKDYTEDLLETYYEQSPNFEKDLEDLWITLKPLYQQLHAYVRSKLIIMYPGKIKEDGPIPAHLVGHIHAQHISIKGLEPFKGRPTVDVTDAMVRKGMKPRDLFKLSEEFFNSLGLKPMTDEFWNRSLLEKPSDGRELVCHASAWDGCGTNLVRIKQCTRVKMSDLIVAHHEMGHIEYYLQYQKLPSYYQSGANPGFHEAVGDTLALSVSTPKHLQAINLLEESEMTEEDTLNYLMSIALDKIAILPSAYFFDNWRWNVYRGNYAPERLNDEWWKLQLEYAGYCPAVRRSKDDFDPASKYHISSGTPYIRYFVANILQFQFYEALCDAAGHRGLLHECDFYRSKEAGKLMGDMLALGSSKPWPEALKAITNGKTGKMDARPILRYFQPLYDWLIKYNMGKPVGWTSPDPNICPKP
ncbi:angiotensin-converting enzyme-like isoform X2 [Varroa jacobsoni]|uniref:angiotensin-converting enzyme-like isoform X2 n=1 Tax=Varroa jacobsoni TaxID=62625 RepID=UPI000BF356E8|nr:angiotensin-converting enzyme-like isoform X2 [Varroa jacobsoni]